MTEQLYLLTQIGTRLTHHLVYLHSDIDKASINKFLSRNNHILVLINGAYGKRSITHVGVTHWESSFGALGIDTSKIAFDALIAASGKCFIQLDPVQLILGQTGSAQRCRDRFLGTDVHDFWRYVAHRKQNELAESA